MTGAFGLADDHHHTRVPYDLIVEANPRLDVWHLLQCGVLVAGAVTELALGDPVGGRLAAGEVILCRLTRETSNLWIDGTRVAVTWDEPMPGVGRPWFECPVCGRRCRHVYLRDKIACRRCFGLQNASLHLRRQTPGVGRVERLRRKLGDCEPKPFAPLPAHIRRGRSRAYHDKLVQLILDQEATLLAHLQTVTRDLERRIEVRKRRGQW